jgi:alpha-ketoglutarate-dependent taurine dioxygenase
MTAESTGALDLVLAEGSPAVVRAPDADPAGWLAAHRALLRAELLRRGAVLVRGLPVRDTAGFAAARDVLLGQRVAYREKATPRSDFGDGVFSSTDLPAAAPIRQHNENSYTLEFPGVLLFGCLVAPPAGSGATTVADVRRVLGRLPADLVARFRAGGWQLRRTYQRHLGLPWTTAFNTEDRAVAERYCRDNLIGVEWLPGDALRTTQLRSAVVHHPRTGEAVWFNHVAFWNAWSLDPETREVLMDSYGPDGLPFQTRYGDGSPLTEPEVALLNAAYGAETRRTDWQVGDLLLVDNVLSSHGREPFSGDRRIVVAMGEPVRVADCAPTVAAGVR